MQRRLLIILCGITLLLGQNYAFAQDSLKPPGTKLAQFDADDSYDPFADYSEFDSAQEEEEDINFFRNGRFISIGLLLGYRGWTENLASLMSANLNYGVFLTYFFDLRFALQFSFLTGSCAYFNEPEFDRPGKPYGNDSSIFYTMGNTPAAFMLWLGDNWYTRETDFYSEWGMWYRASKDRSSPALQKFLSSMPHYAIWDDHDYGSNNADKSFGVKKTAREVFKSYWCNPSYGLNENGIYTQVKYNDVDLFLLDDRWDRSNDAMKDSADGKPNTEKRMWGKQQMDWLENSLLRSQDENRTVKASFRIIVTGSQVLNTLSPVDCAYHYPAEYSELLSFIKDNKIEGVIFLTGDRHHSEIIKDEKSGNYTLYDITVSSLTAGISKPSGAEVNHPNRVPNTLVETNNFGKISVSGKPGERILKVEFIDKTGEKKGEWSVNQKELK